MRSKRTAMSDETKQTCDVCYGARTRPWCSISLLEISLKFDNGIEGDIVRDVVSLCGEKKECARMIMRRYSSREDRLGASHKLE